LLYLVDDIIVAPENTEKYLELFQTDYLPGARKRGLELVACWHTPTDIGEDVNIKFIWALRDWKQWDQVRHDSVTDLSVWGWVDQAKALRKGGTRRFFLPTEFSPLK
jgi:hypothetical protein